MCDKEFMWALKNGDLDEVKDYVAKVSRDAPGWGGRAREGAPGAGPARETAGWRRPGTLWLPVPGSRCVAKAAVAFLTPRGTRVLVVSVDPRGLFYPSRYWNLSLNEAFLHLRLSGY